MELAFVALCAFHYNARFCVELGMDMAHALKVARAWDRWQSGDRKWASPPRSLRFNCKANCR